MIARRRMMAALAAGVFARVPVFAQQPRKVWRVGFLSQSARLNSLEASGFLQGMQKLGYVPGVNVVMEWRFAENKVERLPTLAAELVNLKVDVIVCAGTPAARAAKAATQTLPILFESGDAIGSGLAKSLSHPGGNATGISNINLEIGPKRLELILAMAPKVTRVAVLTNPGNANGALMLKWIQEGAKKTRANIVPVGARTAEELDPAFATMEREKTGAVIVAQDSFLIQHRARVAELAVRYRLPAISGYREFAEDGGLMGYGQNLATNFAYLATYVDKLFKGRRPADLPVEQPTHVELFINGRTAKALGLTIPKELMVLATKVIE